MKIALAQINSKIGDIDYNKEQVLNYLNYAVEQEAELVLFPEYAISGAPLFDLVNDADFVDRCYSALEDIALSCKELSILIGMPTQGGDDFFSSIVYIEKGNVKSIFSKAMIDSRLEKNYLAGLDSPDFNDEGEESEDSEIPMNIISVGPRKYLVVIGSDIDYLSTIDKSLGLDAIFSFSNPLYAKDAIEEEFEVLAEAAEEFKLPIFRVSSAGGNSAEFINFGGTSVTTTKGELVALTKTFKSDMVVVEATKNAIKCNRPLGKKELLRNSDADNYSAITTAIKDWYEKQKLGSIVVEYKETLASAAAIAIVAKSVSAENVKVVKFNSKNNKTQTQNSLEQLKSVLAIENVIEIELDSISESVAALNLGENSPETVIEAIKSSTLGSIAAENNGKVINFSNKGEVAMGSGDFGGDIALFADLYIKDIKAVAKYINRTEEVIAKGLVDSQFEYNIANLPGQKDTDKILNLLLEKKLTILEATSKGCKVDDVAAVAKLIAAAELKRYKLAPIVKMSQTTFGFDRVMPLSAKL